MSKDLPVASPIVKWVGGKRSLLPRLLAHVPERVRTYFEPFAGGAALFFALDGRFERACLNDVNARLMITYQAVRDWPEDVIRRLRRMRNEEGVFLQQRARPIDDESDVTIAAWMLYLNRTCFNGLYRVNRAGAFNVPFGHYANPKICNAPLLRAAARAFVRARFSSLDFEKAVASAKEGDFVYFDPPYADRVGSEFVSYTAAGFGWEDHVRLRDLARALKERGVRIMITNSGVEEVRALYADGFEIEEAMVQRFIAAAGHRRGKVPDFIIR